MKDTSIFPQKIDLTGRGCLPVYLFIPIFATGFGAYTELTSGEECRALRRTAGGTLSTTTTSNNGLSAFK